ncbi:hypothetical protein [Asaia prunellae]|uniref:hypothetical protein n=1 Tax=Asaia prunellae TaxID=610245 RepID=UPI00046EE5DF|nr:hypothetical protein [Asaia prunellae]
MADIFVGDVVSSQRNFHLVVKMLSGDAVLCPFIAGSEIRHRADLELGWGDLVETNLPYPEVRLRAIPFRKRQECLTRIGIVQPAFTKRVMQKIIQEIKQSDRSGVR